METKMIVPLDSGERFLPCGFKDEYELQDLIEKHPAILDVIPKINKQDSSLMLLGREFSVQSGAIDFLATDIEGNIYIIETKLAENPEVRRAIIGQVLEYASNLRDMPYDMFRTLCSKYIGNSMESAIQYCYTNRTDEENNGMLEAIQYDQKLKADLEQGRFNIVIITNKVNFEIQRLFSFIDEITNTNLNFIVLELNKYTLGDNSYIHSNVVWAAKYIRSLFSRKVVTEEEYLSSKSEHVRNLISFVDNWCTKKGLDKVQTTKGISWKSNAGGSIFVSNEWLDTNWSTIKVFSDVFKQFKTDRMKMAQEAGFLVRTGKHGGFRVSLDDDLQNDKLMVFLELSFSVLDKARKEIDT